MIVMNVIPFNNGYIDNYTDEITNDMATIGNMTATVDIPYQIYLLFGLFDDFIASNINSTGDHESLSLVCQTNTSMSHRPQLQECLKSTPTVRNLNGSLCFDTYFQQRLMGTPFLLLKTSLTLFNLYDWLRQTQLFVNSLLWKK